MFYSHEVLTSRKYGIATIWLVATLGSKCSLKKVSRKSILDVDVSKACNSILTPEAPLALRLQSNLLYGVTRVYEQQCGYVLSDAETARNNMRLLLKVIERAELNASSGLKGRQEQLVADDDPDFVPDLALMPVNLSQLAPARFVSQASERHALSPYDLSQPQSHELAVQDLSEIDLPLSRSSFDDGTSGQRVSSGRRHKFETDGKPLPSLLLQDDLGLLIEDGNIVFQDLPRDPFASGAPLFTQEESSLAEQSRAHAQPQSNEHDAVLVSDDRAMPTPDAQRAADGDAESFHSRPGFLSQVGGGSQQQTPMQVANAQIRRRRLLAARTLPNDTVTQLRNGELARWDAEYVGNMSEAVQPRLIGQRAALARDNASTWMLSGSRWGENDPLSIFSGIQLLEALTGHDLRGTKRPGTSEEIGRRVRSRTDSEASEPVRHAPNDENAGITNDDTIERGREAPTPIADRHRSSILPWDRSGGSRSRTGTASLAGVGSQLGMFGRRGSRLTSASPLLGRGPSSGGGADDFILPPSSQHDAVPAELSDLDDFVLFGPAAHVDTQRAADSQWQRAVLDSESSHFLEFVRAGIQEADRLRSLPANVADRPLAAEAEEGSIKFAELLLPGEHGQIVAAQGLAHVLSLATKNVLVVEQPIAFGPIILCIVASDNPVSEEYPDAAEAPSEAV